MAEILLIKIYYETQNDLLESRMKALEQRIRRAKISGTFKNLHNNFLKKLGKILKHAGLPRSAGRAKLIEEIKTHPAIYYREWLLEKLMELE